MIQPKPPSTSAAHPFCSAQGFEDLLKNLLGRTVTVKKFAPPRPIPLRAPVSGVYWSDDKKVGVACSCDITMAATLAAALTLVPPGGVAEAVAAGCLTGLLLDNFKEVLNVCSQLLNLGASTHVSLLEVDSDRNLSAFNPGNPITVWLDLDITVGGYGTGRLLLRGLAPK